MEEKNTSANADEAANGETPIVYHYAAPGAPVVRGSTPRPLPFLRAEQANLPLASSQASFPLKAPDAPPLPEEPVNRVQTEQSVAQPGSAVLDIQPDSGGPANEFIWLFEYALDMDPVRLNRPERLDGAAFAYGPALLKGYQLTFEGLDLRTGQVLASLGEARHQPGTEVWGMLYRVPCRYTRGEPGEVPLLDKVHGAETFVPVEVRVREPYRQREVVCITYVASAATRQQVGQLASEQRLPEPDYLKRLLQIGRRQKLPASYIRMLEMLAAPESSTHTPLPASSLEQDTEPLPALLVKRRPPSSAAGGIEAGIPVTESPRHAGRWGEACSVGPGRWLMAFALYLCLLLLCTLSLTILQGLNLWPTALNPAFTPPGVPWYVLLYSLLGGCISCLISLGRPLRAYPPSFVILTWFVRPFLGIALGSFAYLVLNSGIIPVSAQPTQHFALCSVVGGLAGLCEGRFFLRRTENG